MGDKEDEMMETTKTLMHPGERKGSGNGSFHGPVKGRSCTDVTCLFVLSAFIIVLIGLLGYCVYNGDIHRIVNGYDNCGNVCGKKNKPIKSSDPAFSCTGADKTSDKFLLITEAGKAIFNPKNVQRECVANCNSRQGYQEFLNRCIPKTNDEVKDSFFSKTGLKDFLQEASEDLHLCWKELLYLCLIAFGLSIVLLLLYRFAAAFVVWFVLIATIIVSVAGTIYLWICYKKEHDELKLNDSKSEVSERKLSSLLIFAILATVLTVIIMLVVLVMRKRIQLVVQLFKEAGKAIASMPVLLFQPIVTFISLAAVVALWLNFSLWIETSGHLTQKSPGNLYYQKDLAIKVTRWYNLFAIFWFSQFIVSCQHMIIGGAVSKWFFTRNKDNLDTPILTSWYNLVRYHLGSVAFGSLLIAIVQMIRFILSAIESKLKTKEDGIAKCMYEALKCCLSKFETVLKYWTRNAYIEIAMFGNDFCTAGGRAFKMLTNNALQVLAINSVGDFVLWLSKILIVIATVFIGVEMLQTKQGIQHVWVPLSLAALFALLVSQCFIAVYEMVIDTVFLCFCEDCEQNDGISRPYYMSKGLMEFVEGSKKTLGVEDTNN